MPERLIPGRSGLQAERTALSWGRTTVAVLLNGGLLLLRHDLHGPSLLQLAGGCVALALALFTFEVSRWRRSVLSQRPLPVALADPRPILLLGGGTAALGVITFAVIVTL